MVNNHILTDRQLQYIETSIKDPVYSNTKMLDFFRGHPGMIQPIPEGLTKVTTPNYEKMAPGKVVIDIAKVDNNVLNITESSTTLVHLATKLVIPMIDADRWANNQFYRANLMTETTNRFMHEMDQTIEQFLAWGDKLRDPHPGDGMMGLGVYNGMFNSFTALASGDGGDNNMSAAGDFVSTFARYKYAINNANIDSPHGKYFIFSDLWTELKAKQGAHLNYAVSGSGYITEYESVKRQSDVADWIASYNFSSSTTTNYHMLVMTPYDTEGQPTIRLFNSYDKKVIPLYGGALGEHGAHEIIVLWGGALQVLDIHAAAGQYNSTTHTF